MKNFRFNKCEISDENLVVFWFFCLFLSLSPHENLTCAARAWNLGLPYLKPFGYFGGRSPLLFKIPFWTTSWTCQKSAKYGIVFVVKIFTCLLQCKPPTSYSQFTITNLEWDFQKNTQFWPNLAPIVVKQTVGEKWLTLENSTPVLYQRGMYISEMCRC